MVSTILDSVEDCKPLSPSFEKLKSAQSKTVAIFNPYCKGSRRRLLPAALNLYQKGNLEGERKIAGGKNISFVASWSTDFNLIPSQFTYCIVQFDGNAELSYKILVLNSDFINYLIDVIIRYQTNGDTDFPRSFYYKLLQMDR